MVHSRRDFVRAAAAGTAGLAVVGSAQGRGARLAATTQTEVPVADVKKKLLFLGGTGFLGPHMVRHAVARGHEVTLFNRGRSRPELFDELEQLVGDRDPEVNAGLAALEGDRRWDAVIDTSGNVPRHVEATAKLLGDRCGHYVFVSSMCAHAGWTSTPGANEDTPLSVLEDKDTEEVARHYCEMKGECERRAEAACAVTQVIRPGLIVGPGDYSDRFTYWPVRVRRGGEVLCPGRPGDPVQFIDVRDLAEFIVAGCERGDRTTYNATGPDWPMTIGDVVHGTKAVAGGDARFTWIEDSAWLAERGANAWVQLPCWTDPRNPDTAGTSAWDNSRAVGGGLTFRPLAETIRDTLAWWDTQPEERRGRMRAGLSAEAEAELLEAWAARDG